MQAPVKWLYRGETRAGWGPPLKAEWQVAETIKIKLLSFAARALLIQTGAQGTSICSLTQVLTHSLSGGTWTWRGGADVDVHVHLHFNSLSLYIYLETVSKIHQSLYEQHNKHKQTDLQYGCVGNGHPHFLMHTSVPPGTGNTANATINLLTFLKNRTFPLQESQNNSKILKGLTVCTGYN